MQRGNWSRPFGLTLFGVYSNFYEYKNDHITVFLYNEFTLNHKNNTEIEKIAFFNLHDLPKDISPGSKKRIQEYIKQDFPKHDTW
ncbi:hypothetical protein ACFFMO_05265 [Lederbergia wuyishanensis]